MKMKLMPLDNDNFKDFIEYCRAYRFEHDESYLCESELEHFVIGDENPTFLLYRQQAIVGVASVKIMAHINGLRRGRIRLLHTKIHKIRAKKAYALLVNALTTQIKGIDHLFCFFPEDKEAIVDLIVDHGFEVDRYPCLFVRNPEPVIAPVFPDECYVRPFMYEQDEQLWLTARNEVMKSVKGSEAPEELEIFEEFKREEGELSGGMMLLFKKETVVGCARVVCEIEDGKRYAFIDTIGVLPDFQRKGLGRQFLRYCLQFGIENTMPYAMLSVNAENLRATKLYQDEGFELAEIMTCLKYQFPIE